MAVVPAKIYAGDTCYVHLPAQGTDCYAPEVMMPEPSPRYVWRYSLSTEHKNTAYFFNAARSESVWLLPSLSADGLETAGQPLRAEGSVPSASAAVSGEKTIVASLSSSLHAGGSSKQVEKAVPRDQSASASRKEGEEESVADIKAAVERAMQKVLAGRRQPQMRQDGTSELTSNLNTGNHPLETLSLQSAAGSSTEFLIHEKLAAWRAKQQQQQQSSLPTGATSSLQTRTQEVPPIVEQDKPFVIVGRALEEEGGLPRSSPAVSAPAPQSAVDTELEQVKATVAAERVAQERARRAAAQARLEDMERQRVEASRVEQERKRAAMQEAREMQAHAASELNSFLEAQLQAQHRVETEKMKALSMEDKIAERFKAFSAVESVPEGRGGALGGGCSPTKTLVPPFTSSTLSSPTAVAQQREKRTGTIRFTPTYIYSGDLVTVPKSFFSTNAVSTTPSPSLKSPSQQQRQQRLDREEEVLCQVREGRGVMRFDSAGGAQYSGEWAGDKQHGRGVLSLPTAAVEGQWVHDRLDGKAYVQTQRMRGYSEFGRDSACGTALLEADTGARFAGAVRSGCIDSPGALRLASGDSVEWIHAGPERGGAAATGAGTGECRVRFANGDRYTGHVVQFELNGNGQYVFAREGHEYMGHFVRGLMEGFGTYRLSSGNVYYGEFHKGVPHGVGTYVERDVFSYEGTWLNAEMHGHGKFFFRNGDVWEGQVDHGRRKEGKYIAAAALRPSA